MIEERFLSGGNLLMKVRVSILEVNKVLVNYSDFRKERFKELNMSEVI